MNRVILVLILELIFLAGCVAQTVAPSPTPVGVASAVGTAASQITIIPTPAVDKSTVTGVLETNPAAPKAAPRVILYLGAVLNEARGTPFLAGFERTTSPKSVTDSAGRFLFTDVSPGRYTLILDRVSDSFLLQDPTQKQADFFIEAKAGQIVNLGDLVYISLPGIGP